MIRVISLYRRNTINKIYEIVIRVVFNGIKDQEMYVRYKKSNFTKIVDVQYLYNEPSISLKRCYGQKSFRTR